MTWNDDPPWLTAVAGGSPGDWLRHGPLPQRPQLLILLVPKLFVTNFVARYIWDMVCDLQAMGWVVLDLDAVVQTSSVTQDLARGLEDAGVAAPVDWSSTVVFIHYGQPYHIQARPGRR